MLNFFLSDQVEIFKIINAYIIEKSLDAEIHYKAQAGKHVFKIILFEYYNEHRLLSDLSEKIRKNKHKWDLIVESRDDFFHF